MAKKDETENVVKAEETNTQDNEKKCMWQMDFGNCSGEIKKRTVYIERGKNGEKDKPVMVDCCETHHLHAMAVQHALEAHEDFNETMSKQAETIIKEYMIKKMSGLIEEKEDVTSECSATDETKV